MHTYIIMHIYYYYCVSTLRHYCCLLSKNRFSARITRECTKFVRLSFVFILVPLGPITMSKQIREGDSSHDAGNCVVVVYS